MTIWPGENEVWVTVMSSTTMVECFLRDVRGEEPRPLIVGLDTEWYVVGGNFKMALLQICVDKRCLLFQVDLAGSIPDDLKRFLVHEEHVFVGVTIAEDFNRLWEDYRAFQDSGASGQHGAVRDPRQGQVVQCARRRDPRASVVGCGRGKQRYRNTL